MRPAQFVPESKKIDQLLRDMQKDKIHIAIVVDEYGGTSGLVTIEDLVEEIVGEIRDEYDVEQEMVLPVSETEALMDARVPFEDVRETFDLDLPPAEAAPDYDTLGGFVVAQLGRFPKSGEAGEAKDYDAIAIVIDDDKLPTPCGACRQVIAEFAPDVRVVLATTGGLRKATTLTALLPEPFLPGNLS